MVERVRRESANMPAARPLVLEHVGGGDGEGDVLALDEPQPQPGAGDGAHGQAAEGVGVVLHERLDREERATGAAIAQVLEVLGDDLGAGG